MSAGAPSASVWIRRLETGAKALTTLSVALLILARSIACRTASAAVSDPSVPTTIRVNTPPPSLAHRTAPILAAYSGFGRFSLPIFVFMRIHVGRREAAEPEADDFFR